MPKEKRLRLVAISIGIDTSIATLGNSRWLPNHSLIPDVINHFSLASLAPTATAILAIPFLTQSCRDGCDGESSLLRQATSRQKAPR